MIKPKHTTLCFECEWAAGKDGKCPWAREFKPVPGWKAEPTTINAFSVYTNAKGEYIRNLTPIDSFVVCECPLFELADAIKKGIVKRARRLTIKKRINKEELQEKILRLRGNGMTYEKIGDMVGYDKRQVWRIYKKLKENEENGKEI